MTTIEVWTDVIRGVPQTPALLVARYEAEAVPRVGDLIEVFDGWAAEPVQSVTFRRELGVWVLRIRPDSSGEYRDELRLREARRGTQLP